MSIEFAMQSLGPVVVYRCVSLNVFSIYFMEIGLYGASISFFFLVLDSFIFEEVICFTWILKFVVL